MKHCKSKLAFFSILVLFIGTNLFTSCSKEEQKDSKLNENTKVNTYLKSFYSKDFKLGKSIDSKITKKSSQLSKTVEFESIIITEVFVDEAEKARGYVIIDKTTKELIYFIDVDRIDFKLTSVDFKSDDVKVFNNIDELDKYVTTDKLDFIKIVEEYNATQSTERRFWGWQKWVDCDKSTGQGYVYETYYVLGVGIKTRPIMGDGGQLIEPCAGGALGD